ncbi:MAG: N-formylglutamate amidohydrolase [Shimia sp.]
MHDPDAPFHIEGADRPSPWLVTCDHATNRQPDGIDLGLPEADMQRHIAYDIGALGVARALAGHLDAPCISSNFSRLVIDPNRGEDDPTLLMKLYDGSIIPGNRHADAAERDRRLAAYHRPYHDAYAQLAAEHPILGAIHSFTPQLNGRPRRPWHVGILHAADTRLADPVIRRLELEADLTIGRNEPYSGHLPGDAVDRHALQQNRLNILIEIRNDLIGTAAQQKTWAARLAPILQSALSDTST